ncbi:hypothetical protein MUY35_07350 [Aliiroseovarius sp. S1339]|uniref:hypothetical protein n=1 Tax=Aliiroseovarius sp. S1339 TaxID=2936990 RepID=UPI0020BE4C4E|nr:hypothetical protein [Aliiroseovarius sp. S1339]MCK8463662.1 hypothetical protein [Aliiroseovarius sp. S1339]
MKPNFALDLSHDGIGLVHRGKGGWALVGEVSVDHPEQASGLDLLRRKAADLESGGFSCKLIVPKSQLLFTSMIAPGPDDVTRMERIREGLEGLTPYDVDDLVFDWRADPTDDGMVHVAVVARETLDEAEAFANDHSLNPISFVARPSGSFSGEAFFGTVKSNTVTDGATVERDHTPVPDLLGSIPDKKRTKPGPSEAAPPAQQTEESGTDAPALPELAPFPPTPDAPVAEREDPPAVLTPDLRAEPPAKPLAARAAEPKSRPTPVRLPETKVEAKPDPKPTPSPAPPAPVADQPPAKPDDPKPVSASPAPQDTIISGIVPPPPPMPPVSAPRPTSDAPTFSSRRVDDPSPMPGSTETESVETANEIADEIDVKPRLSFGVDRDAPDGKSRPDAPDAKPVHVPVTAPIAFGDDPALKPAAQTTKASAAPTDVSSSEKLSAVARKGAAGLATAADAANKIGRKAAKKIEDRRRDKADQPSAGRPKVNIPNLGKRQTGGDDGVLVTAVAPPPPHLAGGEQPPKAQRSPRAREAETMTVFGARQTQHVGGKPKFLGLFLVLGLLLLMAIVAIWSMFFLTDSTAWLFPEREDQFEAAISTDPDANAQEGELDDVNAGLEDEADLTDARIGARDPLTPEAAQARYAATGIWQRAPEPLPDPESSDLDDLYIASIDPAAGAQDAVALPDPKIAASAAAAVNTAPPPPLGTTFALDSDGLVIATPDGALSPEGITVFSGRPAVVPALRPGVSFPEVAVDDSVAPAPTLPLVRPRARPEGLIEGNERLELGGRTRIELAALRPRVRPTTPRAAAQAAAITAALQAAEAPSDNDIAGNPSTAGIIAPTRQAIATSIEPRHRPSGFNKIVARANTSNADASDGSVAVAAASPQQSVVPRIPTRTSVAKQATIKNAINLRKVSLIGIYGSASSRRALVRLKSGRYVKVGAGSRLDGGKVLSISASALVYKKGSRTITLEVLPFS